MPIMPTAPIMPTPPKSLIPGREPPELPLKSPSQNYNFH